MKLSTVLISVSALLVTFSVGYAAARAFQDPGEQMTAPQPTEMHRWIASHLGTWDCQVEGMLGDSKGTWVAEAGPGGLWSVGTYRGEMMGGPFEGREFLGYDPASETFRSVWIDSWITAPLLLEGTYDAAAKELTMKGEMPGPDGKPVESTQVTTYPDPDTMVFSMSAPGPDGQMAEMMKITYKRRK